MPRTRASRLGPLCRTRRAARTLAATWSLLATASHSAPSESRSSRLSPPAQSVRSPLSPFAAPLRVNRSQRLPACRAARAAKSSRSTSRPTRPSTWMGRARFGSQTCSQMHSAWHLVNHPIVGPSALPEDARREPAAEVSPPSVRNRMSGQAQPRVSRPGTPAKSVPSANRARLVLPMTSRRARWAPRPRFAPGAPVGLTCTGARLPGCRSSRRPNSQRRVAALLSHHRM
jgi:hypothetical protein